MTDPHSGHLGAKTVICPLCAGNPIDPKELEAFVREMTEVTIPSIVEAMRRRAELANQYRGQLYAELEKSRD